MHLIVDFQNTLNLPLDANGLYEEIQTFKLDGGFSEPATAGEAGGPSDWTLWGPNGGRERIGG